MRALSIPMMLATTLLAAAPALASFSGDSKPQPSPMPSSDPQSTTVTPRQQAERLYVDAYDEVAKAKKDVEAQKRKNADKKFKKAMDRATEATELDSTYHEAWNLIGYCARQLKKYDQSIAAYDHALRIKPDYAPAREYLGEAYIDLDQPDKAREQLAYLKQMNATAEAAELEEKLGTWLAAHPDAAKAEAAKADAQTAQAPAPAAADTLKTPEGR